MRIALRIGLILLLGYIGAGGVLFATQRSLLYVPNPERADLATAGLPGVVELRLPTQDGETILAWWRPPADATRPVFLYLHGNGANLTARARRFERVLADGAGLMAVSWRGYGGSSGSPTEQGLMSDARTAQAALAQRVDPRRIVYFGESLGTSVAVMLAAERAPAALILDSSFTSIADVAAGHYWWLPVRQVILDPFRADLAAPRVRAPVLQVHCATDPITPIASAEALARLFAGPVTMHRLDGRCHPVPYPRMEAEVAAFLARLPAP